MWEGGREEGGGTKELERWWYEVWKVAAKYAYLK